MRFLKFNLLLIICFLLQSTAHTMKLQWHDAKNDDYLVLSSEYIQYSKILTNIYHDSQIFNPDVPFPLQSPAVTFEILNKIMQCLKYIHNNQAEKLNKFFKKISSEDLISFIITADYLDIPLLLEKSCKQLVKINNTKKSTEINDPIFYLNQQLPLAIQQFCAQQHLAFSTIYDWLFQIFNIEETILQFEEEHCSLIRYSSFNNVFVSQQSYTLTIWDYSDIKNLIKGAGCPVEKNRVIFGISPDTNFLISANWDTDLEIWDSNFNLVKEKFDPSKHCGYGFCFSPNGKFLAAAYYANFVKIWDTSDNFNIIKKFNINIEKHGYGACSMCFSPDSNILAVCDQNYINIFNIDENFNCIKQIPAFKVHCFSPDGTMLVTTARDKSSVNILNATDFELIKKLKIPYIDGYGYQIKFSPDGRLLAINSRMSLNDIALYNAANDFNFIRTINAHHDFADAFTFSPDGKFILFDFQEKNIRIVKAVDIAKFLEFNKMCNAITIDQLRLLSYIHYRKINHLPFDIEDESDIVRKIYYSLPEQLQTLLASIDFS